MVAHILKYHVPMDEAPYSCSLCNFRCTEPGELMGHVQKYRRHVEESRRRGDDVDLNKVLRKSDRPFVVGDQHMRLVGQVGPSEGPEDSMDGIYEDQETSVWPSWLQATEPTPVRCRPGELLPTHPAPLGNFPQTDLTTASTLSSFRPVELPLATATYYPEDLQVDAGLLSLVQPATPAPVLWQAPQGLTIGISSPVLATTNTAELEGAMKYPYPTLRVPSPPPITPPPAKVAKTEAPVKPVSTPTLNILPGLLAKGDASDPLLIETAEPPSLPEGQLEVIVKAIQESTSSIVRAIDSNSRAIREQSKALELYLNRRGNLETRVCSIERRRSPTPPRRVDRRFQPRSRSPAVKSVIVKKH